MKSRTLALLLTVATVLSACTLQTAGGVKGDRTFVARFDDVQHLVIGHSVRLSDVNVGTVTSIRLDGYIAEVEMSIVDGRSIPTGTIASISATSLLGENYVKLTLPNRSDDPGGSSAAELEDGAELATGPADTGFEELTAQLLTFIRAINGRDLAAVVEASAEAFGGRGDQLNALLVSLDDLGDQLTEQVDSLVLTLDSFASLGDGLVDDADVLADTFDKAAEATEAIAAQSDRAVAALESINEGAAAFDRDVLVPYRTRLDGIVERLDPIAEVLANEREDVISLLRALRDGNELVPRIIDGDSARVFGIVSAFIVPGIGEIPTSGSPASGAGAVTSLLSPTGGGAGS